MKTLTIRLPESLLAEIEQESEARCVSKSDVVRQRLSQPHHAADGNGKMRELIGDLLGSVSGLRSDLASNKKKHLPELIRAEKKLPRR